MTKTTCLGKNSSPVKILQYKILHVWIWHTNIHPNNVTFTHWIQVLKILHIYFILWQLNWSCWTLTRKSSVIRTEDLDLRIFHFLNGLVLLLPWKANSPLLLWSVTKKLFWTMTDIHFIKKLYLCLSSLMDLFHTFIIFVINHLFLRVCA